MMLLFFTVFLFSFTNGAWLLRRIQNTHHSIWVDLGRPTFALSNGVGPRLALVKYIWSLRFRELNDLPLAFACWSAIAAELLLVVIVLLLILGAA
jgi:hypothetical protein